MAVMLIFAMIMYASFEILRRIDEKNNIDIPPVDIKDDED